MVDSLTVAACAAITIGVLLVLSCVVAVLIEPFDRFAERMQNDDEEL